MINSNIKTSTRKNRTCDIFHRFPILFWGQSKWPFPMSRKFTSFSGLVLNHSGDLPLACTRRSNSRARRCAAIRRWGASSERLEQANPPCFKHVTSDTYSAVSKPCDITHELDSRLHFTNLYLLLVLKEPSLTERICLERCDYYKPADILQYQYSRWWVVITFLHFQASWLFFRSAVFVFPQEDVRT